MMEIVQYFELVEHQKAYDKQHALRRENFDVQNINQTIESLLANMCDLLVKSGGVGLAAPQVGVSLRLFLALLDGEYLEFINPQILHKRGGVVKAYEGCLSIPGRMVEVPRFKQIEIEWYDVDGKYHKQKFSGDQARIIQHEYDHLEGRLILDYE